MANERKVGLPSRRASGAALDADVGETGVAEGVAIGGKAAAGELKGAKGNFFEALMHDFVADHSSAIDGIRAGFPASVIKDTSAYFEVPTSRIRAIARVPETTAHTLVKRGAKLDAAASERIWRLADLLNMAKEVFEDDDAAKTWLRTPNRAFRDLAPMDYLDTEPGAMAVRQVLNAIGTGGVA